MANWLDGRELAVKGGITKKLGTGPLRNLYQNSSACSVTCKLLRRWARFERLLTDTLSCFESCLTVVMSRYTPVCSQCRCSVCGMGRLSRT